MRGSRAITTAVEPSTPLEICVLKADTWNQSRAHVWRGEGRLILRDKEFWCPGASCHVGRGAYTLEATDSKMVDILALRGEVGEASDARSTPVVHSQTGHTKTTQMALGWPCNEKDGYEAVVPDMIGWKALHSGLRYRSKALEVWSGQDRAGP